MPLVRLLLKLLFLEGPQAAFPPEEAAWYERLYQEALHRPLEDRGIRYDAPYPKWRFLVYIARSKPIVLHGSNQSGILQLEPRRQTLYSGRQTKAVFASKDGIWPVFYAVLDRKQVRGGMRNACLGIRSREEKFYFFSVGQATLSREPWVPGTVYLLPEGAFIRQGTGPVFFDEWTGGETVRPAAWLQVEPEDFYWRDRLVSHRERESVLISWLLYKNRLRRNHKEVPQ